jgi:hypothetical protein
MVFVPIVNGLVDTYDASYAKRRESHRRIESIDLVLAMNTHPNHDDAPSLVALHVAYAMINIYTYIYISTATATATARVCESKSDERGVIVVSHRSSPTESSPMSPSAPSPSPSAPGAFGIAIALVFLVIELAKVALERACDTRAIEDLQRDIIERRRSLARELGDAADAAGVRKRMDALEDKMAALERARTPRARLALKCAHWLSAAKACAGAWACFTRGSVPVFTLPRRVVWPLGAWLSFPYGLEMEGGVVAVVPWTLVSAVGCERVARGVVGPVFGFCIDRVLAMRTRTRTRTRTRAAREKGA